MICFCGKQLIHGGDHDYEDYGCDGEGIVSNLSCPNDECNVKMVLVYSDNDEQDLK